MREALGEKEEERPSQSVALLSLLSRDDWKTVRDKRVQQRYSFVGLVVWDDALCPVLNVLVLHEKGPGFKSQWGEQNILLFCDFCSSIIHLK